MSSPSEAMRRAMAATIDAVTSAIVNAHTPHCAEVSLDNFALNVLVNALGKSLLTSAGAECAALSTEANSNAIRVVACMKAARVAKAVPEILVNYIDANADEVAKLVDALREAGDARERGSVQ